MVHLRGPEGCPWDRAQDYDSVKGLLLEEAYEVIDAVSERDFAALEDELGDLLFQVVFYSRLAEEENRFNIDGVIEGVRSKLIRRHPHVFGETRARTPEEALKSWNAAKEKERQQQRSTDHGHMTPQGSGASGSSPAVTSLLGGIAPALPSTLEAYELGLRASEAGFDWRKIDDLLDKIEEELRELRQEMKEGKENSKQRAEEEVGDLLLAASNLARKIGSDPESCLRRANQKFRRRFQVLEQEAQRLGKKLTDFSPQELDGLWETAKAREAK